MITPKELKYITNPEMQKFFQSKIDGWDGDDMFISCFFVPDVYSRDAERPERGLIGMCEGIHNMQYQNNYEWEVVIKINGYLYFYGTTLRLALLKAIAWQIGVEV